MLGSPRKQVVNNQVKSWFAKESSKVLAHSIAKSDLTKGHRLLEGKLGTVGNCVFVIEQLRFFRISVLDGQGPSLHLL